MAFNYRIDLCYAVLSNINIQKNSNLKPEKTLFYLNVEHKSYIYRSKLHYLKIYVFSSVKLVSNVTVQDRTTRSQ